MSFLARSVADEDAPFGHGAPGDVDASAQAAPGDPEGLAAHWRKVGRPRKLVGTALCAGDAAILLALWAVLVPFGAGSGAMPRVFLLIALVTLLIQAARGLYPGYRLHGYELLRRRCTTTLAVCAVSISGLMLVAADLRGAVLVAGFLAGSLALQPPMRALLRGLLFRSGVWGEDASIVGEPRIVAELQNYFIRHWQYGIVPVAENSPRKPTIALVAGGRLTRRKLKSLCSTFADVLLLADFPGVPISGLRPSEIEGAVGLRLGGEAQETGLAAGLHRAFDLVVACLGFLLALPLLVVAATAIYVSDPGPVLYRQPREGYRGGIFEVLKLRTMYRDADARLAVLLAEDDMARAEWETHFKLRNDPRILPGIGGLLRATSIDELPQLLNVLAGDMRLVGPRPFPVYHLAAMDRGFRARRRSAIPGLTGLWQISERSNADLERQCQLDDFYIANRSFWFDMHVLLKTLPAVVRGDGAY